jgi:uncharacterized coiled-coil protein SlyX
MTMEWDANELWRRQVERRLNELGSKTHGNQKFQADRISDLLEMIDELRNELHRVSEKQELMGEWIKANLVRKTEE